MAKFTLTVPIDMTWRGHALVGSPGTTHRISDSLRDEFIEDFVTGKNENAPAYPVSGLVWITEDEIGEGASHPNLATHDAMGIATQSELDTHTGGVDPHTTYALDSDLATHEGTGHTGPFARGGTLIQADGLTTGVNIIVWRAPFACTVTAVKGYRVGGTGATVNARRNGTSNHLSSAVSVASADTWTDGGAVQNTAYATGDKLEIMIVTVTDSPTQVAVQVDFTRP